MGPGFQVLVARHGVVVYEKSFGFHTDKKNNSVKSTDVYDVSSLTKILALLLMMMKAEEDKKIKLTSTIKSILPTFKNSNKDTLTVLEILSHYGRLKAWIPFYKLTQDSITNNNLKEFYSQKRSEKFLNKFVYYLYFNNSYKDSIYKFIRDSEQRPGSWL